MVISGASYRAAGAAHGVDEKSLRRRMRADGTAPARPRGAKLRLDPAAVAALHDDGMTQTAIARKLGASQTAVANALTNAGVTRASRSPVNKRPLTDAETVRLKDLWSRRDARRPALNQFVTFAQKLAVDGVPMSTISVAAGAERSTVHHLLARAGMLPDLRQIGS